MAFGNSIVIFNTAVNSGGTPLAAGVADPHYSLISAPNGVLLTALATTPNPAWVANTVTAGWISPGDSGSTDWPGGNYDYQTTFSLAGLDPTTTQLTGEWAVDNTACISINGVMTGNCIMSDSQFGTLTAFSFLLTTGLFQTGTNRIDFIVNNESGPTGLIVDNLVATASPVSPPSGVPEPSSMLLLGAGLLGLSALRRRKTAKP
jgi:hypothetical protein